MSHCPQCSSNFSRPALLEKHMLKCTASKPSFEQLTQLVFAMKVKIDEQQREIEKLKGNQPIEFHGVTEPPTLHEDDLIGLKDNGLNWVVAQEKNKWPVLIVDKKFFYAENETMVPMTDEHLQKLRGNVVQQLSLLLVQFSDKHHLLTEGDPKNVYSTIANKIYAITTKDLKRALLAGIL